MNKEDMNNIIIPHVVSEENNVVMKTFSPETGMFIDEHPEEKPEVVVSAEETASETGAVVEAAQVDTRSPAEQYRDAVYAQRRETAKLIPGISKFGTEYFVKKGVLPKIEIASDLLRNMFKRAELLLD